MQISQRVKELRKQRGFTQDDLSEKSGVSISTIKKLETEGRQPKLETIDKLAFALGVDNAYLLGISSKEKISIDSNTSLETREDLLMELSSINSDILDTIKDLKNEKRKLSARVDKLQNEIDSLELASNRILDLVWNIDFINE